MYQNIIDSCSGLIWTNAFDFVSFVWCSFNTDHKYIDATNTVWELHTLSY